MDSLTMAMLVGTNAMNTLARSALPDAPVVPDEPRRPWATRAARPRAALAGSLNRLARVVAPAPSTCHPAS
ncbi:MAG TPA: hypothetical protein VHN80_24690 [Kineosporiaceae bacterium]|jgi:hypothetical protein|nr:hypothetical protein [Kineosporiaceae bacterium]